MLCIVIIIIISLSFLSLSHLSLSVRCFSIPIQQMYQALQVHKFYIILVYIRIPNTSIKYANKNIPGSQPGLRIKFKNSQLSQAFPDQFEPFRFFGCDFSDTFPGTLFRFPLRTQGMAKISEISRR